MSIIHLGLFCVEFACSWLGDKASKLCNGISRKFMIIISDNIEGKKLCIGFFTVIATCG